MLTVSPSVVRACVGGAFATCGAPAHKYSPISVLTGCPDSVDTRDVYGTGAYGTQLFPARGQGDGTFIPRGRTQKSMTNNPDQLRDRIGQFAATSHAEARSVSLNPLNATADGARARRREHQAQMGEVGDAIAVDSAVAMAAHTRAMFPTAQRVVLIAPDGGHYTPEPYEVLDGEGNALASRMYGWNDAFNEWVGDGETEGNLHLLAGDVDEHGGRLDGVLTDRAEGPGNYVYLELDIDRALELEMDPPRSSGIDAGAGEVRSSRSELVGQRRAITAQIGAMDVNDAAAGIQARYPTAATIEARTTGEDDVVWAEVRDADGNLLTAGDADDPEFFTEFDDLNLVPNKYKAPRSPLRTCTSDNDETWIRRYDLNKMAALTADELLRNP